MSSKLGSHREAEAEEVHSIHGPEREKAACRGDEDELEPQRKQGIRKHSGGFSFWIPTLVSWTPQYP